MAEVALTWSMDTAVFVLQDIQAVTAKQVRLTIINNSFINSTLLWFANEPVQSLWSSIHVRLGLPLPRLSCRIRAFVLSIAP